MAGLTEAQRELRRQADATIARRTALFFKTGPGEYGEGDAFLGIRVPVLRELTRRYHALSPTEVRRLLRSRYHEERALALFIMVHQYQRGDAATRQRLFDTYLEHLHWINNWDLVDCSAEHIVGAHLREGDRSLLARLARSPGLWERRVAILATFTYIKQGEFTTTLELVRQLLDDEEDLIHKAAGWMLREIGKRDMAVEEAFLREHHARMPRTMLRYAVERFPDARRRRYVKRSAPASKRPRRAK